MRWDLKEKFISYEGAHSLWLIFVVEDSSFYWIGNRWLKVKRNHYAQSMRLQYCDENGEGGMMPEAEINNILKETDKMEFVRITNINDVYFAQMHKLMGSVFPPEEVLAFDLWEEPLKDEGLRVVVAVHEGEVVGATEYRYYPDMGVAMTDFTIIGREGLGIGPFLARERQADLFNWVKQSGGTLTGMFAEIYNPYLVQDHAFGGVKPMDPFVRREVLSHLGYRRLDFPYVHPSWELNGEAVSGLDLCFLAYDPVIQELPAQLVVQFLQTYYAILPQKPPAWQDMIRGLQTMDNVRLMPI
jgi:hypothetical protein